MPPIRAGPSGRWYFDAIWYINVSASATAAAQHQHPSTAMSGDY